MPFIYPDQAAALAADRPDSGAAQAAQGVIPPARQAQPTPPRGRFVFPEELERSWTQAAGDTAVQLAEGVNTILGAVPSLVSPDGGVAGFFRDNAETWRRQQSQPLRLRADLANAVIDRAGEEGVIAQVIEAASQYSDDPGLAARFVFTNLPSIIPTIGAAKLAQVASAARTAAAVRAGTMSQAAATAAGAAAATTAGGVTNAALNAGGARDDAFQDIKRTLQQRGYSEEEANERALADSRLPAAVGGVTGFISGRTGLESALFGVGGPGSALRRGAGRALWELGGEQLEEVAPKVTTNYQAGQYDGRDLTQDVGRTIVETAIGSGPIAAAAGVSEAMRGYVPGAAPAPAQAPAQPPGPTQAPPAPAAPPTAPTAPTGPQGGILPVPGAGTPGTGALPPAPPPPADLDAQNRDRSRPASVLQMQSIANNPDYLRLGPSRSPDTGAPMVFAEGDDATSIPEGARGRQDVAVMSDGQRVPFTYAVMDASLLQPSNFSDGSINPVFGDKTPGLVKALNNGRSAGLRSAWAQGTAAGYAADLEADAAQHGVDPAAIRNTRNPVLVRLYSQADNKPNMAARSQGQGLGMSPGELARQDASLIDSGLLGRWQGGDVTDARNRDFVRGFVGRLQGAGQGIAGMMTHAGTLSPTGRARIQAALAQSAYGDADLINEMFDSTDTDIKAIGEALKIAAPEWADMRDSVRAGTIDPGADITKALLGAVAMVRRARQQRVSLADLARQTDITTGMTPDPMVLGALRLLYGGEYLTRPVGRDRMAEFLREYTRLAKGLAPDQGLFGDQPTPMDVLNTVTKEDQTNGQQPTGAGQPGQTAPSGGQPPGGGSAGGTSGAGGTTAARPGDGQGGANPPAGSGGSLAQPGAAEQATPPVVPGSDAGNGFKHGAQKGERYRASVVAASGGALAFEKRLPAGTVATFYVGKDGNLIDGDGVNFIGNDRDKLWIPEDDKRREEALSILDEMGRLALTDPARKAAKDRLKALVTAPPAPPAGAGYEARLTDRRSRIAKAKTKAEVDAVLQDEYKDGERHFEGTSSLEKAARARIAGFDAEVARREREAEIRRRLDAGQWVEDDALTALYRETQKRGTVQADAAARKRFDDAMAAARAANPGFEYEATREQGASWDMDRDVVRYRKRPADAKPAPAPQAPASAPDRVEVQNRLNTLADGDTIVTDDGDRIPVISVLRNKNGNVTAIVTTKIGEKGYATIDFDGLASLFTRQPYLDSTTGERKFSKPATVEKAATRPQTPAPSAPASAPATPQGGGSDVRQGQGGQETPTEALNAPAGGTTGTAPAAPPAAAPAAPPVSPNTIFTEDAANAARARLRKKLGRLQSGIDPETMLDGITLAGYHIERGARRFAAYARAMVEDLGDAVKPYLVSWYLAVRNDPRAAGFKADMDRAADVEDVDLDAVLAQPDDAPADPVKERVSLPDGMEMHLFTTGDGWGIGQFDTDAKKYVDGSVQRWTGDDAEARAREAMRKAEARIRRPEAPPPFDSDKELDAGLRRNADDADVAALLLADALVGEGHLSTEMRYIASVYLRQGKEAGLEALTTATQDPDSGFSLMDLDAKEMAAYVEDTDKFLSDKADVFAQARKSMGSVMPSQRDRLLGLGFEPATKIDPTGRWFVRTTRTDADGTRLIHTVRLVGGGVTGAPRRWVVTQSTQRPGMASPPDVTLAEESQLEDALSKSGLAESGATAPASAPAPSLSTPAGRLTLAQAISDRLIGGDGFKTIVEARKFIEGLTGQKVEPGTQDAKLADETIEMAVVLAGREMVKAGRAQGRDDKTIYDRLVGLYQRQPTLGVRTSTSVREQAYSTPVPLAFLASRLAGIQPTSKVGEPTAGNTMLLVEVEPGQATVNELNADRAANAKALGFEVTRNDAARTALAPAKSLDVAIMNPPFGTVKDDKGETVIFPVAPNYGTREVDHAIAFKALEALKDNGTAVLILGGVEASNEDAIRDGYRGKSKREFYFRLYNEYGVVDHFTVDGGLYSKQGAGYPVDVVVIRGRGKATRALPAADLPRRYDSWDTLKEKLDVQQATGTDGVVPPGAAPRTGSGQGAEGRQPGGGAVGGSPGQPGAGTGGQGAGPGSGGAVGGTNTGQTGTAGDSGRGTGAGDPQLGTTGGTTPANGGASDGAVSGQGAGGNRGGQAGAAGDRPGNVGGSGGGLDQRVQSGLTDRRGQETETATQVTYEPKSGAPSVGTLVPRAMRDYVQDALASLAASVGDLDEYVAERLNFDPDTVRTNFSAEQVDALALAISAAEIGRGFIIGDQTGIGKGRIVAGMIRYAIVNDKTPVFVTEKPNLYADMIRDLDDIGMSEELRLQSNKPLILMTNANQPLEYTLQRKSGESIVETTHLLKPPGAGKDLEKLFDRITGDGDIGPYKVVFTTYSQMQTIGGKMTARMRMVQALAQGGYMIFDESHNAGGGGAKQQSRGKSKNDDGAEAEQTGRAAFVRTLVASAFGSFFSSATYAKRADVMDLYSSTDMMLAVDKPAQLAEAIMRGGVPMQQIVATMLSKVGQYLRRERTFAGISYDTRPTPVDRQTAENMAQAMRMILEFSRLKELAVTSLQNQLDAEGAIIIDGKTERHTIQSANFGAIMHNLIDQMLLALKVDDSVAFAIERLRAGEKVVLTVANTMGSFLGEYAKDMGLRPGDPIELSFSDLYERYLDKQRRISIKRPGSGVSEDYYLTDEDLGETAVQAYKKVLKFIRGAGFGAAPISPIDYLHQKLREAGFKTDEITGRKISVAYGGGQPTLSSRNNDIKDRLKAIRGFNGGEIDALILNQSGATGLSLHASAKFKDKRKRRMIIVQAEKNIDTHMQMLGRVHRTGQVTEGPFDPKGTRIQARARGMQADARRMAALEAALGVRNPSGRPLGLTGRSAQRAGARLQIADARPDAPQRAQDEVRTWNGKPASYGLPSYTQTMADIPAEMRPASVLMKKMASLNANTTANRKSAVTAEGVVDFMNDYGGQVAAEFLMDNPDVHQELGGQGVIGIPPDPLEATEELIRKLTGYIPILPIAQQEAVYKELMDRYNELIAREDAMGTNKLEAKALDLGAKTLKRTQVTAKRDSPRPSPFAEPSFMEQVDVARTVKPLSKEEVIAAVQQSLNGRTERQVARELITGLDLRARKYADDLQRKRMDEGWNDDPETRARMVAEIEGIRLRKGILVDLLNKYQIGMPVVLLDSNQQVTYGVITDISSTGKTKSPVAGSAFKFTLALANGEARSITISAGQIDKQFTMRIEPGYIEAFNPQTEQMANMRILDLFDAYGGKGTITREKRWMVTGNLLAGFAEYPGRIVSYTKDDGTVAQGVLMSRGYTFKKKEILPTFESAAQVMQFFSQAGRGATVAVPVGGFSIVYKPDGASWVANVMAPKSKRFGAVYYLDRALENAFGETFSSVGSFMRMQVWDRTSLANGIEYIFAQRQDIKLAPTSNPEVWRPLLGIPEEADNDASAGAKGDGKAAFKRTGARQGGMRAQDVQAVVDTVAARWEAPPPIVVVQSMQDPQVPIEVRDEDAAQRERGATGTPNGFVYGGTVYIVADGVKTVTDVIEAMHHESVGHFGLRAVFGSALGGILDQIAMARPDLMRPKAAEYGKALTMDEARASVNLIRQQAGVESLSGAALDSAATALLRRDRREVAEEVLAGMAELQPELGFVRRAVAAIRTWLRANVPGFRDMRLSDDEIIRNYIAPARGFILRGEAAGVQGAPSDNPALNRAPGGYEDALRAVGTTPEGIEQWRAKNKVSQRAPRVPVVQQAAQDLFEGRITPAQYRAVVAKAQPIRPITQVPKVPSFLEAVSALKPPQVEVGVVGLNKQLAPGTPAALRLDIPAYDFYNTWVVSIHDGSRTNGNAIGYGKTGYVKNADFRSSPRATLNIARGAEAKAPGARIHGEWVEHDSDLLVERAQRLLTDPEWTQVGTNPFRQSFFYDKADGMPIVSAEEVVQVGPLVLARGVKKTTPEDERFRISGTDIFFSRGASPSLAPAQRAEQIINRPVIQARPLDRVFSAATRYSGIDFALKQVYNRMGYLLNRFTPERLKAGIVADYGKDERVTDLRARMQGAMRQQLRRAGELIEALSTLTREESRIAYEWMNMDGSDPRAYISMMQGLPEESVKVLQTIQRMIDDMSKEAVRLGQLDPRSYERNKFAYLRRTYERYIDELTPGEKRAHSRATRILGDQYRMRGLVEPVDMAKIKAGDPEWWGRKEREGRGDAGLINQKFIRLERLKPTGAGTMPLPGMTGRPEGKVLEVVYWPAEKAIPIKYSEWRQNEVFEVRDVKGGKVVLWRDFTKQEREDMGEIDEARFAIARTMQRMIHDVEVGRYLEKLSQDFAKADGDEVTGTLVEASESWHRAFTPDEWVKVPDTKVPGTSVLKYGKLAGKYLPGPIWNDVRFAVNGRTKPLGEVYDKILSAWKISKTALSPAVHTNNIMANIVMADWHDVGAAHVAKALRIILAAHDRKGEGALGRAGNVAALAGMGDREAAKEVMNRYRDAGGDIGSWATQELARGQMEPLLDAVLAELGRDGDASIQGQIGVMAALQHLLHLRLPEAWAAFKQSKPTTLAGREARSMIDLYQAEDDVFRLAAWLAAKERGMDDLRAGRESRKSFLDYDINAPWVEAMRRTGWPFIAFTYRAVPMLARIAGTKPHKILKLSTMLGALNAMGVALSGDDEEDDERIRRMLPEQKSGDIWGIVPKLIRMPWNDDNGSPVYLDIRRFVPVGDVFDTGATQSAVPVPPGLMPGGPLVILGEVLMNKSAFTGKPIAIETDTAAEQTGKILDHLIKAFAPNLPIPNPVGYGIEAATGVSNAGQTYAWTGISTAADGKTDVFGREQSMAQAVASGFGVKLGSYPEDVLRRNTMAASGAQRREIETVMRGLQRQRQTNSISQEEFDRKIQAQREKLRKLAEDTREKIAQ